MQAEEFPNELKLSGHVQQTVRNNRQEVSTNLPQNLEKFKMAAGSSFSLISALKCKTAMRLIRKHYKNEDD